MTADTHSPCRDLGRPARRWVACVCAAGLLALAGCKTNKETNGAAVARGKDPLVFGPSRIPRQDLPVPDRATGPTGRRDPLTTPTGGKVGYTDDPERFKGTFIPGTRSTPAALAGRINDGEELKIADAAGVPLTPAGGTLPGGLAVPAGVDTLYSQLEKFGVTREDRTLEREGGRWVFRAAVPISGNGARRQYTGANASATEAVKQVAEQIAADRK